MNLPYFGHTGDALIKKYIKTLKRNIRDEGKVAFVVSYATIKISFYTNTKDRQDRSIHKIPPLDRRFDSP